MERDLGEQLVASREGGGERFGPEQREPRRPRVPCEEFGTRAAGDLSRKRLEAAVVQHRAVVGDGGSYEVRKGFLLEASEKPTVPLVITRRKTVREGIPAGAFGSGGAGGAGSGEASRSARLSRPSAPIATSRRGESRRKVSKVQESRKREESWKLA